MDQGWGEVVTLWGHIIWSMESNKNPVRIEALFFRWLNPRKNQIERNFIDFFSWYHRPFSFKFLIVHEKNDFYDDDLFQHLTWETFLLYIIKNRTKAGEQCRVDIWGNTKFYTVKLCLIIFVGKIFISVSTGNFWW